MRESRACLDRNMKNTLLWFIPVSAALMLVGGCAKPEPEHHLVAPPPVTEQKIPVTKEEKLEAIKKAHMSKEMKQAAMDKVNAGP